MNRYYSTQRPTTPGTYPKPDRNPAMLFVKESDGEDKETICKLLCKALQKTRGAADLVSLTYDSESEIVIATFEDGTRKINVACDSGTAMIRDIVNHLGY